MPDTAAFTKANNDRALHFAIRAITAQPVAYLHVVASDTLHAFGSDRQLQFPATPASFGLGKANGAYALAAVRAYLGTTSGIGPHLGSRRRCASRARSGDSLVPPREQSVPPLS